MKADLYRSRTCQLPVGKEELIAVAGRSRGAQPKDQKFRVAAAGGVAVVRLADEEWQVPAAAEIETQ